MGWLFTHGATKQDIVNDRIKPWTYQGRSGQTLAYAVVGNVLWSVKSITETGKEPIVYIGCDLLENNGDGWGYKDMDESMHPYLYNCPLRFLTLAPVKCQEWRDEVKSYHAKRNRKFTVGEIVKLKNCNIPQVTITSIRPLLGTYNGTTYKIPRKLIDTNYDIR